MALFEHGFALLIGVDENNVPGWALPAVAKDIAALEQVLAHPERCAYPPGHIKILGGKNATRQNILDGLEWLQEQITADAGENTTAIIHYSGHGWRDLSTDPPAYFLIPYDVRQENLRSRALRAEDFAEAARALAPRRLLVILDCCHAAGMEIRGGAGPANFARSAAPTGLWMGGARAVGAADGAQELTALAQGQGRAVLSSSQGDQPSYNRRDGRMGIFTYHLIEALTGHAQPQAGASEVLVSDVMSHVWRCVPRSAQADWGRPQQPDYQVSGNFPIALLLGGRGVAEGRPAPDPLEALPPAGQAAPYTIQAGGDFTGRDRIGGDQITVGSITGSGSAIAIGRNARVTMTTGVTGADLERVFAPIFEALREVAVEKREEAAASVQALKEEAARGSQADDKKMAKLLDGLLALAPGTAGAVAAAVAGAFGSPLLASIAGPLTSFVLEKFRPGS